MDLFGRARIPVTISVREGQDLVGIFSLLRSRGAWRSLRAVGTGNSDYLDPLFADATVAPMIAEAVAQEPDVDLIDLHQVRENSPVLPSLAGSESRVQARCPVLDLPDSFEAYTKTLSKSLRYDISKGLRGPGVVEVAQTPADALAAFEIFLDLHKRRWRTRGLPGAFSFPKALAFHRRWVAEGTAAGIVQMSVLRHEGQPIGALYVMRAGTSAFFFQSGFDPDAKALSPGTVLIASAIRRAIDEGCTQFDFLRGDEPYKLRWKPQNVNENHRVIRRVGTLRGAVGQQVNTFEAKIEDRIRARLEGKGLLR